MANEGGLRLDEALKRMGVSRLAGERMLGVSKGVVGRLISGERKPGRVLAAQLSAPPWRIPLSCWDTPAATATTPVPVEAAS